ncbi:MAG: MaoC family dehydratase N-terminal domain-containing protein [Mycobacteriales bacterium]
MTSTEFEKATDYALTDADIERAHLLLGVDVATKHMEHITTATFDSIRNFAWGVGDDNPLYCDEDYGTATRWGSQVAPNSMAQIVAAPLLGDPMPAEIKAATKGLFRGIHVFVSGGSMDWYRPIFPGDKLYAFSGEESIEVKDSEFAGRSVIQVSRDVKFNQRGEVVSAQRVLRVLAERKTARERGKNNEIEPASYTDDDIAAIDAIYASEQRRGADVRWWEDVSVGDAMSPMVKGPLTTTEVVAFHAGGYGFVPYGLKSSRLAYKNRMRIAPFFVKNSQGVPDVAQRLHWDSDWAKAIGNPMAYDYGVMRQCWFQHYTNDWAGDDAFVTRQSDSMRKFNYHGDVQHLSGSVVGKREEGGLKLVDLQMKMTNQRGVDTSFADVTVCLPSRKAGQALMPVVPEDLQRRATAMYERHNQLLAEKKRS